MQSPDILDWELAKVKENPIKINLKFDSRLYVWKNQILPGRLAEIIMKNGSLNYINRMVKLLHKDQVRLCNRARKEYHNDPTAFYLRVDFLVQIVTKELQIYQNELKKGD